MKINIEFDSTNETVEQITAYLTALADALGDTRSGNVIQMEDRRKEQESAAPPAKKAAPRTRKAAAPAPEPEEDLLGDATLDAAIERAKALVQAGRGPLLKKALRSVGVDKVRDLEEEQVAEFMSALDAEED